MEPPFSPSRQADDRRPALWAISIVFPTLALASLCARFYTRAQILRNVGLDDMMVAAAMVLSFGVSATAIVQLLLGGLGRHSEFATPAMILAFAKSLYATILIYNAAQFATKISFLILYRRLFPDSIIKMLCDGGMAFLGLWFIAQQILSAISCESLMMIAPTYRGGCIANATVLLVNAVVNIATDFMIFLIPVQPVLNLRMSIRRKAQILLVFCLGLVACAISIVRLLEATKIKSAIDPLWDSAETTYWSIIELNVGILCACLSTLRPLIQKFAPGLLGSADNYSHKLPTIQTWTGASGTVSGDRGRDIHKDLEFGSTTELRADGGVSGKPGSSVGGDSFDGERGNEGFIGGSGKV
ncbi:hypothetical protein M011DRAFT_448271 [Sporormia fimetaria CBS 119925]|uniref:Rhodopsin domain-containing protein n=1 Tax=Sporormia fimetaria CBS 119925 TaxID=1340428 RepID=A0A6A6V4W3_9PLEO|nr:hypothetical protein M011DRAFT_448271 [Sporormia fimetaria CBS 119925]